MISTGPSDSMVTLAPAPLRQFALTEAAERTMWNVVSVTAASALPPPIPAAMPPVPARNAAPAITLIRLDSLRMWILPTVRVWPRRPICQVELIEPVMAAGMRASCVSCQAVRSAGPSGSIPPDLLFPPPGGRPEGRIPLPGAAGPGDQLVLWACPMRTRCPDDAGLPFACCRVTVIVGYWVGGTPDHNVTSPDWLNVPMGTSMPAAFFSHAW